MRLPDWVDRSSRIMPFDMAFLDAKSDHIINRLGQKHLSWWEHKGSNQCQICDLIVMNIVMREHINKAKPSLDSMNNASPSLTTGRDWEDVLPSEAEDDTICSDDSEEDYDEEDDYTDI